MFIQRILLTILLVESSKATIYDVTTIYRRDLTPPGRAAVPGFPQVSLEIHARTNALGLPFRLPNNSIVEPTAGVDLEPCNSWAESCSWTVQGWNTETVEKEPAIAPVMLTTESSSEVGSSVEGMSVFSLSGGEGIFTSPKFLVSSDKVCVSLHHFLQSGSSNSLEIFIIPEDGNKKSIGKVLPGQDTEWMTSRFVTEVDQDREIQVEVRGTGSASEKIYIERLSGCNPEANEDMLLLYTEEINDIQVKNVSPTLFAEEEEKCLHSGKWNEDISKCICAPGFIGEYCEMGCGENRFGHDCLGACSDTDYGCKGITLCKYGAYCTCAPGYEGPYCNISCDSHSYGPDCNTALGQCDIASGTQYTGICVYGCKAGYYPQFCKDRYKHLASAPTVSPAGLSSLSVEFSLAPSNLIGSGEALFYQIQYKNASVKEWEVLPPQTMSNTTITRNITGLSSGYWYNVRVIILCEDYQFYEGDEKAIALARTSCSIPEEVDFSMTFQNIYWDFFSMDWKYEPQPTWCPFVHFEVELKDSWRWTLHYQGTYPGDSFNHLRPGTKYQIKMRVVTIDGPSLYTKPVTITTQNFESSPPFNLILESITSTSMKFSWEAPRDPTGEIKSYRIFYSCTYAACPDVSCDSPLSDETNATSYEFTGLTPLTQYTVQVSAIVNKAGSSNIYTTGTPQDLPEVAPEMHPTPVLSTSDTSITVQWKAPSQCKGLNGFLQGYRYRLVGGSWLDTVNTNATLDNLKPSTEYNIEVIILTSAGWNESHKLNIPAATQGK